MSSDIDVILTIEADVNDGGWRMFGQVFNDADALEYYQGIEVLFDLYLNDGWEALPRPAFIGHLLPETWQKTFQTSIAPFNGFTAQEIMKKGRIQGIWFKEEAAPANQHQITGMSFAKIVEHIVGKVGEFGHCNLNRAIWPEGIITTDIDFTNSTQIGDYLIKEGNFWDRLQEIADIDFYLMWIDKANVFHFEPHPMFDVVLPEPVFDLDQEWLAEPLQITTRNSEQIGQVILSGNTPAGLQIFGRYPSLEPTPGQMLEKGGYIATSDVLMPDIAERIYKFENRGYSVVAQVGNGLGLLIDLLDRVSITYQSANDGINWTEEPFWVHRITVQILSNFTARTTLQLEGENLLDVVT